MGLLVLNSRGLNRQSGTMLIYQKLTELGYTDFSDKKIFVVSYPEYEVDDFIISNCIEIMGFKRENIYMSGSGIPQNVVPDFLYVTEGNTFEVLKYMRDYGIVAYIKEIMLEKNINAVYIGSSAGAMIAGSDIMPAADFDSNFVGMIDCTALGLFDGTIIPHYESEDLERYRSCTEEHILNRYANMYSVGEEEVVVMKMEKV